MEYFKFLLVTWLVFSFTISHKIRWRNWKIHRWSLTAHPPTWQTIFTKFLLPCSHQLIKLNRRLGSKKHNMRKCAILDFGCFDCGLSFLFFSLRWFFCTEGSSERGKFSPLATSYLRQKFYRHGEENWKNKSTVHDEIFGVRAYTLLRNGASSQATTVSKHKRIQQHWVKILRWDLTGAGSNFCSLQKP